MEKEVGKVKVEIQGGKEGIGWIGKEEERSEERMGLEESGKERRKDVCGGMEWIKGEKFKKWTKRKE